MKILRTNEKQRIMKQKGYFTMASQNTKIRGDFSFHSQIHIRIESDEHMFRCKRHNN